MRLEQLAAKCKRRGGDCPCEIGCEAEKACDGELSRLLHERQEADRRFRYVENILRKVQTPPATLRAGFTFRDGLTPVMVFDGDEACFGYEDANGEWTEANVWPFNESYVWADDCERHGIRVE